MRVLWLGGRAVVAIAVVALVVSTLFDAQEDQGLVSMGSLAPQLHTGLAARDAEPQNQAPPADLMSALQGHIHVDLLGAAQGKVPTSSRHSEKEPAKDIDDMSLFSGAPIHSKVKTKPSDVSLVVMSGSQGVTSNAALHIASMADGFRTAVRQSLTRRLGQVRTSSSITSIAIAILLLLIFCTCVAALGVAFPRTFSIWSESQRESSPEDASLASVLEQRALTQAQKAGGTGPLSSPGTAPEPFLRSALSPFTNALMPVTSDRLALQETERVPVQEEPAPADAPRPPPLCPTLVMPVCEARFGIPMYELAQLSAEGDLSIVGLSGNPLLRAVVRKIGDARTLEIGMPEQNSAPRATISPSAMELAGRSQQGSRALEIRGIRGSFYGILEMRSSGACYVVKDGQTVLTIDGDAESLQLSIKSSVGLQLASVRCSAEPFGGVDHVEIRVEPAVDTVLVLAVVLAVLLLSPYLTPSDQ